MTSETPGESPGGSFGSFLLQADRTLTPFENLANFVAGAAVLGLMLLGVMQIVLRSVFNSPIVGYIDLVELSMAVLAFLGAAYCQRLGGHIRMELLLAHLRGRTLWIVESIGTIAALGIIAVIVWFGWDHFLRAYELGDTTIDAEFPVWPSKLLVPIAFAIWWGRLFIQLLGSLRLVLDPDAEHIGVVVPKDAAELAQEEIRETFGENQDDGR
ncbi:TRAP transporter small permease [Nisaea sp.]|uniref:TRAP transporter small permease subunit n=1 Tax=Nisaea sp. TaxID=2024842 RepID=UPI0032EC2AF6